MTARARLVRIGALSVQQLLRLRARAAQRLGEARHAFKRLDHVAAQVIHTRQATRPLWLGPDDTGSEISGETTHEVER